MGSWGVGGFSNDDAADWLSCLYESNDFTFIDNTLSKVLSTDGYLEAPDASRAIAAAEVVARFRGGSPEAQPNEALDRWAAKLAHKPSTDLTNKAIAVTKKVLAAPSELLELWQEGPDFDRWKAAMADMAQRLASADGVPVPKRNARPKRIRYDEGDIFAVPLRVGGHSLGLVARSRKRSPIVFGYFFDEVYAQPPRLEHIPTLTPSKAIRTLRFGDLSLINGEWPIIAKLPGFSRMEWPLPRFARRPLLSPGLTILVEYFEDDPGEIVGEEIVSSDLEGYQNDGLCGAGFVEIVLTKLLLPQKLPG